MLYKYKWRGVREAEGARLETVCCASNRGFESPLSELSCQNLLLQLSYTCNPVNETVL
jgi:hypothetical protein